MAKEPQKFCPFCGSADIFEVGRIDHGLDHDVFYRYRCGNCGKVGIEIKNNNRAAWDAFNAKQIEP